MPTLALLRHAKAIKDEGGGDHARRLSDAGRVQAAEAGDWLRGVLSGPVLVLVSDARRTRETADLAFPPPQRRSTVIRPEAELYGALASQLLERIQALGAETTVVVVGHNPGIGEAARLLAAFDPDGLAAQLRDGFPTSACAVLHFDGPWADVGSGRGRLAALRLRDRED